MKGIQQFGLLSVVFLSLTVFWVVLESCLGLDEAPNFERSSESVGLASISRDAGLTRTEPVRDRDRTTLETTLTEPTPLPEIESIPVRHMRTIPPRTPVQLAPSFYMDGFGSERARRRASERFNRSWPEERIIGSDRALYDVSVLVFSRAVVSEANWIHRPCDGRTTGCDPADDHNHAELDGPAMFQVFRRTRLNFQTFIGIMRSHMNYVTEEIPATRSRTRWVVELDLEGHRPRHFPAELNWERDYLPRWRDILAMSRRLFAGRDLGVCAGAPIIAWGGRCEDAHGACDDDFGRRRGLVPYDCGNTSNRFWCRPGTPGCVVSPEAPAAPTVTETAPETTGMSPESPPEVSVETPEPPTDSETVAVLGP